jgi:hypothetical protein
MGAVMAGAVMVGAVAVETAAVRELVLVRTAKAAVQPLCLLSRQLLARRFPILE